MLSAGVRQSEPGEHVNRIRRPTRGTSAYMSSRLPVVTAEQLRRALVRAGWYEVRQTGSHLRLRHDEHPEDVTIAIHAGDIPTGTLRSIIRQIGLTVEEFRELLR